MDDIDEPGLLPIDTDISAEPVPSPRLTTPLPHRRRGHARPDVLAMISAGGALGATARYGIEQAIPNAAGGFPWATFWINISGSLVLGLFLVIVLERLRPTRYLRPFFATGFVGSFTTFSTFAVETDLLIKDGHITMAAAYALSTLAVGLFCAWLGIVAGRLVLAAYHHDYEEHA